MAKENKNVSKKGNKIKKSAENKTIEKKSMTKKEGKRKREEVYHASSSKSDEITKLVEVILIILVVFAAFYLITSWVTKSKTAPSNENKPNKAEEKIIQYDEILLGNLLREPNDEYYVLAIKEDDSSASYYKSQIATYDEKEGHLRVYTSQLANSFNKKYLSEESNLLVENSKDLKVKDTTLFRIKNGKVEEAIEGTESIVQKFAELVK